MLRCRSVEVAKHCYQSLHQRGIRTRCRLGERRMCYHLDPAYSIRKCSRPCFEFACVPSHSGVYAGVECPVGPHHRCRGRHEAELRQRRGGAFMRRGLDRVIAHRRIRPFSAKLSWRGRAVGICLPSGPMRAKAFMTNSLRCKLLPLPPR
jgi:hypothetical protein